MLYLLSILYVVGNTFAPGMSWWKCWDCEIFIGERIGPNC